MIWPAIGDALVAGAGKRVSRHPPLEVRMAEANHDDVTAMSFEAALAELEGIVSKLESGQAPLAESIAIYERGEALKAHCESLLKSAEARIEKITLSRDGKPVGTEPLDK
jgi:exodeoxyribonuclease VII small subunit